MNGIFLFESPNAVIYYSTNNVTNNVKMPTTVGILILMSRIKFMLNRVEIEKKVYIIQAQDIMKTRPCNEYPLI